MAYIEEKKGKDKITYYLVQSIRLDNKWKKVRYHLADGKKSKDELKKLKSKYIGELEKKVRNFLSSKDELFSFISEEDIKELEAIKSNYAIALSSMDSVSKTKYWENFLVNFTYDTNAIEGSTLTRIETALLLTEGTLPSKKNLREIHEAENHKDAFNYTLKYDKGITKHFILKVHKLLMHNILNEDSGRLRKVPVMVVGADTVPPKPEVVQYELSELLEWYRINQNKYNPIVIAAYFHAGFEGIHPFVDGNGRTGRLIMNYMLMKDGFPPINIENAEKGDYYESLKKAHKGNLRPLVRLIIKYLKRENKFFEGFVHT